MKYEIAMKYKIGDKVFAIINVNEKVECKICEGHGMVKDNMNIAIRCSKCNGKGKCITGKTIYETIYGTCTIEQIQVNINKENFDIQYVISVNGQNHIVPENHLFTSFKEAQLRCNKLNSTYENFYIDNIIVPTKYTEYVPPINKIQSNLKFYNDFKEFASPIKINQNNELIDGYISYLLCKLLNIKQTIVVIEAM